MPPGAYLPIDESAESYAEFVGDQESDFVCASWRPWLESTEQCEAVAWHTWNISPDDDTPERSVPSWDSNMASGEAC
jgi:hypothetical protein